MTRLAEDLLLLARVDAGTLQLRGERIGVDDLARSVAEEAAAMAEARGVVVRTEFGAGDGQVSGDGTALRRLLTILLDNAVQHTPSQGRVAIETMVRSGEVAIAVRDSGQGVNAVDLPHIFERFYRGDPARTRQNGAGLGLAIAQSIAQAHGTRIEVQSKPGEGAVFSIRLPLVDR